MYAGTQEISQTKSMCKSMSSEMSVGAERSERSVSSSFMSLGGNGVLVGSLTSRTAIRIIGFGRIWHNTWYIRHGISQTLHSWLQTTITMMCAAAGGSLVASRPKHRTICDSLWSICHQRAYTVTKSNNIYTQNRNSYEIPKSSATLLDALACLSSSHIP